MSKISPALKRAQKEIEYLREQLASASRTAADQQKRADALSKRCHNLFEDLSEQRRLNAAATKKIERMMSVHSANVERLDTMLKIIAKLAEGVK